MYRIVMSPKLITKNFMFTVIIKEQQFYSNWLQYVHTTSGCLDDLYVKWKDKIIYSSYIENNSQKLGFKQNKIVQSKIKQLYKNTERHSSKFPPFPVVANQFHMNPLQKIHDNKHACYAESLESSSVYQLPYKFADRKVEKIDVMVPTPDENKPIGAWMSDYEHYDEDQHDDLSSFHGTPDPNEPASKIPCGGCGALLHCIEPNIPGFLPSQLYKGQTKEQLMNVICQRCHFLKHYNIAVNVSVSANDYVEMLSSMKKQALAVLLVDVLDFPCSIWPGLAEILGPTRPVIVVGNKIDLLPQDSPGYLDNVRQCLTRSIIQCGFSKNNIKHVSLISAGTAYGVEELITKIHNIWGRRGDIYLVGCTNVGKSTLFNALLRSDMCKVQATDLIQRATASPWPGTTIRMLKFPILRFSDYRLYQRMNRLQHERTVQRAKKNIRREQVRISKIATHATLIGHIGRTFEREKEDSFDQFSVTQRNAALTQILALNEKNEKYINSKWCYDTPGVVQPEQILDLLTIEELSLTIPKQIIRPRTYLMKPGLTIFLAGLGRLDYVEGPKTIRIILYAAHTLPTMICDTVDACELYTALLGTKLLSVPFGNKERLDKFPPLQCGPRILMNGTFEKHITAGDILLSSVGWVGVNLPKHSEAVFHAWTPNKRGVFVRQPPLLPNGLTLRGKRIRKSLAYRTGMALKDKY
uniref:G domain-containing protein n=1 Tax=Anopheles farauti TaxID=69004 RepID=A0A182QIV6_9DIPT